VATSLPVLLNHLFPSRPPPQTDPSQLPPLLPSSTRPRSTSSPATPHTPPPVSTLHFPLHPHRRNPNITNSSPTSSRRLLHPSNKVPTPLLPITIASRLSIIPTTTTAASPRSRRSTPLHASAISPPSIPMLHKLSFPFPPHSSGPDPKLPGRPLERTGRLDWREGAIQKRSRGLAFVGQRVRRQDGEEERTPALCREVRPARGRAMACWIGQTSGS
jgi:hypothetical protein